MLDDVSHNWSTLKDPGIRHDGEYPKHAYIHTNYGELRKQVYSYLIPTGKLLVGDYVQNLNVTTSSIRTHYLLEFEGVQPPIPSVATTYFVRSDEFNLRDIDLGIAGVTKKLNTEVSMKLYERQIQFNGSPKSALAFLHDRTRHLECLTNVSLRFLCGSTKAVQLPHPAPAGAIIPPTNIVCWRKMLNVLVHYCPNIKNVELSIDSSFWDSEPWTKSVHTIYESPFGKSPFLYQARANYGDGRWEYSKSFLELIARFHKAHFKLSIDEPAGDLEEKKAKAEYGASWRLHYPPCKGYVSAFPERSREFREKLEKHMMKKMEDRPAYNQFRLCDCDWKKFTDGKPMLGTSCIYTWKGGEVMKKKAKDLWV
ncbi:hypothetical protein BU16DRAFT_521674 [Lophium mytilinum]|uniref:Uncharacterized protein n=1 Tax=Lophium mytilinum TaxID=390894 RepID=A0A6A6RH42_9PEZI|nr:hypothetical protein BU16DRAFT_521674 [Lophium mytilinum]